MGNERGQSQLSAAARGRLLRGRLLLRAAGWALVAADPPARAHVIVVCGQRAAVIERPAPYSAFDPDTWWRTRNGVRIELTEFQKLLFDLRRHPFS